MNKIRLGKTAQRALALVLSITLVLGGIPLTAKADNNNNNNKLSDPSTMHTWQNWFPEDSTEFAGGVWTDKSVFESVTEFETALGNADMDVTMTSNDNFLVALSALASNKEIVGYSTIPTDTVFILDVSQSMDNSRSVPQMVASANEAMKDLLALNNNNRVGVVLYSGNGSAGASGTGTGTKLLGLERYTANSQGNFLTYSGSNNTTVSIADGLTIAGGTAVSRRSKTTDGGTYIQNGLSLASDIFEEADEKVISSGNVQGGTKRMPIIVLMSDGAPTTGTQNYTNIQTSTVGNGTSTSAGLGFMTQLTAAYLKEQVETWYGGEAKFYTLGLNLSGDNNEVYVANSVLNPQNSLAAINTYWDNLFNNGRASFYSPGTSGRNNQNIWVTVNRVATDGLTRDSQNYVTQSFAASGNAGLEAAFTDIVNEIILQSAYYPTLIKGANTDLDGYLTFEDEIGQFMEVKNITGLTLGDTQLFTGAALTKMMGSSEFGDRNTYTELGWELVESVAERIGVSQDVAIELLKQAWADGQLSYTDDKNFSNYIGWYEDENNDYLAYWNEAHTEEDIPQKAKYITRSYGFYGTANTRTAEALGSDMMHIVIKVRTEIKTKHQDVVFMIPASLIPIITYHVELDSDSFDTASTIKLTTEEERPIRLLFEVGLRSDIHDWNIDEVLAKGNLVEGQHIHKNADGTYYFYTNQWGDGDDNTSIDYNNPSAHLVTETHFHPNIANERYYYTTDTVIYEKIGTNTYRAYTGATAPTGGNYYFARRVFNQTNASTQEAEMTHAYVAIASDILANTQNLKRDNGTWYIVAGTIHQEVDYFQDRTIKEDANGNPANYTGTLDYYAYHIVERPNVGSSEYDVWGYHGNNGRLTVTPATGLKITKLVDETVTDIDAEFEFYITLSGDDYDGTYRFIDAAGNEGTIQITDNKSDTFKLKANETVYIVDLPVRANFTVAENNANYKVESVAVNGTKVSGITATGEIQSAEIADVVFTNTARQYSDLIISKTITHDYGNDYVIPTDKKFDVEVTLSLANGTQVETSVGTKTVSNGKITFQLGHGESVTIYNLVEGTNYTVNEVNLPNGFNLATPNNNRSGVIAGNVAEVNLVNDYAPTQFAPTAEIDINVSKTLKNVNGSNINWNGREFKFYLEKLVDTTWERVTTTAAVAKEADSTFTVQIPEDSLKETGRYLFRIHEDETNLEEGIVSDTAVYFVVVVTDKDMDGALEVEEILVNNIPVADETEVNLTFTNTYVVTEGLVVHIPIKKTLENNTGVNLLPSGFQFGLYEGNTQVGELATTNANGDATLYISYTTEWYDRQTKNQAGNVEKTYTLKEIAGSKKGMTYTDKVYDVTVEIGINNTALELVKLSIDGDTTDPIATFTNQYELTNTTFAITGTKTLNGREIGNDKYTFNLYKTDSDFAASAANKVDTTENTGNTFQLEDVVETAGVHYYVIEEAQGDIPGVIYDTTKYHVTVVAKDNNNGGLAIANSDISIVKLGTGLVGGVEFVNEYKAAAANITITGTKVLTGKALEHDMFEFVLSQNGTEISRTKSTATGTITFPEMEYTEAGDYVYTVSEVKGTKLGYTYDDSSFRVTVKVTDDKLGQLHATISDIVETDGADGENTVDRSIVFRNEYIPTPAALTLNAVKLLENRHLTHHEFAFHLYEADSSFNYGATPIETVRNAADGKVEFAHAISEAGTYYFVMKEDVSNPASDIVYDKTEYQITVIVYDQGGYLSSRATYAIEGRAVNNLVFSNVFVPQDPVQKDVYAKNTPDISIDGEAVKAGDILTYEIDYTNFTIVTQNGLVITDTIPTGTTYVEGSASTEGFVSYNNGVLKWEFNNVEAGEVIVVTFDVKVKEGKANITNQAHVEIGNNDYSTNTVTNYTFDKEVDKSEAKIGEELTYTIKYKNTEKEAAEIIIVDQLVEGLTYVEGSATNQGIYDKETHSITWVIRDVAALADGEVSFKTVVNENAVEIIDNVARIKVGNNAEISVETDTVETEVLVPEIVAVKKQAIANGEATTSQLKVKTGDEVTYYITVTNEGNLAAEEVVITDDFPTGMDLVAGSISHDGKVANGIITWSFDEVKAGESITVSFKVKVTETDKGALLKNVALATHGNDPIDPDVPDKSNEVTVEYVPTGAPQTGDSSSPMLWSTLAAGALMICAVLLIIERKGKYEE